jgi:hypothetical protein
MWLGTTAVHHQVVVCCEFDVYSPMLRSCLWASTQKPYSHIYFYITNCEKLPTSFMCNKFFSYKLPAKFNTKYYNCTVKDKLPLYTSLRRGGVKVWLHPFLILIPDEGDGQLQSFDCCIPRKETAARVK